MAEPVVALLYQGGRFGPEQTAGVATLLRIFAWAVPAWIVQQITVRGFYAREDMWRPMLLGTSIALVVIPLYWQLGTSFGASGLAAAGSIGMTANAVATLCLLRWLYGAPDLGVLAASGLRAALASAVAGGAALLVPDTGVGGLAGRFVDLALPAAVFGGVGIAAVYAVGDAPLRAALDRTLRRLRRGSG
jgi:putative peptidoglycan lipid II flippase